MSIKDVNIVINVTQINVTFVTCYLNIARARARY